MQHTLLVILLSVVSAFGQLNGWNALHATWNAIPFKGFDALPRQLTERHNFVLKDNQCDGGKFRGQRYWSNNDPALILIFDKNGIIAGMQTSIPKTKYRPTINAFQDDGDYWTQTAYFVDPSTICSAGRTAADLEKQGTGTGLWFQTGPDPTKNLMAIPLDEAEAKKSLWGFGRCFPTMGQHYWYNVTVDMNCDNFFPNCLLYNKGKLNAFCFAENADLVSPRYDYPHPTNDKVKLFMNPVPKCFFSDKTFEKQSTLHVYFHSNPRFTSNC